MRHFFFFLLSKKVGGGGGAIAPLFLVKKPRGKILNDDLKYLYDKVQYISENIYKKFAQDSKEFCYGFFPYFKLVKFYGNYHYHFLDVRKDYEYE